MHTNFATNAVLIVHGRLGISEDHNNFIATVVEKLIKVFDCGSFRMWNCKIFDRSPTVKIELL